MNRSTLIMATSTGNSSSKIISSQRNPNDCKINLLINNTVNYELIYFIVEEKEGK